MKSIIFLVLSLQLCTFSQAKDLASDCCLTDIRDPAVPWRSLANGAVSDASFEQLHTILGKVPPSIETCLANFNPIAVLSPLMKAILPCVGQVEEFLQSGEINELKAHLPQTLSLSAVNEFLTFLTDTPDCGYGNVCSPVQNIVNQCINEAVPTLFFYLEQESKGCCAEFFTNAQAKVGMPPGQFLVTAIQHVVGTVCTVSAPGWHNVEAQYCGYRFVQMFLGQGVMGMLNTILPLLVIPNDQGCAAYRGETFTSTLGSVGQLFGSAYGMQYGSCAVPLDGLLSFIGELPIVTSQPLVNPLFADQQVLEGSHLLAAVLQLKPELKDSALCPVLAPTLNAMRFHLANHFASTCTFEDEAFLPPFDAYPVIAYPTPPPTRGANPADDTPIESKNNQHQKDPVGNGSMPRSVSWGMTMVLSVWMLCGGL